MKILFVSRWFPYPPDNGARIRVYNLIRHLARHHEIDLISFRDETWDESHLEGLRPYCDRVWSIRYEPERNGQISKLLGFFYRRPRSMVTSYSHELQQQVDTAERSGKYDLLLSSEVDMGVYTQKWSATPKVFEELELTSLYEQSLQGLRGRLTWWKYTHYLPQMMSSFQGCTVVSERERQRVRAVVPDTCPVEVIPNGVDTQHYQGDYGPRQADTLVYSGALTYSANLDAMQYFLGEVFPLVKARRPNARVLITGNTEGVDLSTLPEADGFEFTGYVDDIRPVVARSQASIVPLRLGGGTRLKVLESLALGTPVISTSKGAEGLDLTPGRDYLAADTPQSFADAILEVLENPMLAGSLSCRGREAVEARYDWTMIGQKLDAFLRQALPGSED